MMEGSIKLMDTQTARAILSEVAQGGWLDRELPEDEKDLIDLAQYFYDEAKLAIEESMDNDYLHAIIRLADSSPVLSEVAVHNHDGTPPGESEIIQGIRNWTEDKSPMKVPEEVAKTYPRRSSGGYSESDLRETEKKRPIQDEHGQWGFMPAGNWIPESNMTSREGLPIPQSVSETDPYDMSVDVTDLGDKAVRRLYSAFGSYLSRVRWLLAIAESNLSNATHLRDAEYRVLYSNISKSLTLRGERATKDLVDSLAKEEESYKEWDDKVEKHTREVIHWKALRDIYGGNVERLSREWTMRQAEWERDR